eukprot:TRINITY_DN4435_c0_g1_i2.p2 TRINITY_DN4435_c0_g1~~TRINITY_DN4435_c0_g1_i2.p2  ORF type:complete len:105 (+),score=15.39 TRINITY_DN4435_c0_g1_i2:320-634(+)
MNGLALPFNTKDKPSQISPRFCKLYKPFKATHKVIKKETYKQNVVENSSERSIDSGDVVVESSAEFDIGELIGTGEDVESVVARVVSKFVPYDSERSCEATKGG